MDPRQRKLIIAGVIGFLVLIFVIVLSNSLFMTIEAGSRGVLFKRFGGGLDKKNIYGPGFHIIAPWNLIYVYDVRETQLEESMTVLSSNGLNIKVDVTARVAAEPAKIGELHEIFGPNYVTSLIRPELRSAVRKIIGRFEPEELYSSKRDEVQRLIQEDLEATMLKNYTILRAVLIRDIELPNKVQTAIEEKIEAEQKAFKYEYLLEQERKEKERVLIEASAKAEANRILTESLNDKILRDKGIEATLKLATSPNSKIVIIGSAKDGLPIILGQ